MKRPAKALAPDVHIAVASKGRVGRTPTLNVLPNSFLYVPALEAPAYKAAGARNVVPVPNTVREIIPTRNWILRNCNARRVVMIDDDVKSQGWTQLLDRSAHKQSLDEAAWVNEFRKLFEVTEGLKLRIWGVATEGATRSCYPYYPFRFRSYITASCMGIVNDGRTYFDETYPHKEDYELCARCITEDGAVVCAQYLFWENSHWHDPGGVTEYRTQARERESISRLCKAYPGLIRAVQRKNSDWCVEIVS